MSSKHLPTKSNMMKLQNSLRISRQGHELLDNKKIILTREIDKYKRKHEELEKELFDMMEMGRELIKAVNIDIGVEKFAKIADQVDVDDYIDIKNITLMGVEIPSAVHKQEQVKRTYEFYNTTNKVDEAMIHFNKIQEKLIEYAIQDTTIKRLKTASEKARKRANALQNVIIPEMEKNLKEIIDQLDERDREEFATLKLLKKKI
ncbi:MAG: V-type ATP synthase subunit D [Clostridia bacterium]|nr:V-type ATP synthase subunit D [Clostridia bacterium]